MQTLDDGRYQVPFQHPRKGCQDDGKEERGCLSRRGHKTLVYEARVSGGSRVADRAL